MQLIMNKVFDMIFSDKFSIFVLFLTTIPFFFVEELYSREIYFIFFFFFSLRLMYQIITMFKKGSLRSEIVLIITDTIGTIALITPFKIIVLFRLLPVFKVLSERTYMRIIIQIIKDQREMFKAVLIISIIYMGLTSLLVFNIEPKTFGNNYLEAFYWSGIMLTTVGFGDVYPITAVGKGVAVISSFVGVGIIALPTGLIAADFRMKFKERKHDNERKKLLGKKRNN